MKITKTTDARPAIVSWGRWCVANKERFVYDETRPMPYSTAAPIRNDCSGTVTLCYYLAGAPDPNGQNYDGEGYTGTLIEMGTEISIGAVQPGDVVIYGANPGVHCALVVTGGPNPLTMSHGQPSEPALVYVSDGNPVPSVAPRFFRFQTSKTTSIAPTSQIVSQIEKLFGSVSVVELTA